MNSVAGPCPACGRPAVGRGAGCVQHSIPEELWHHPVLAQAMADLDLAGVIRFLRDNTEMTQEALGLLMGIRHHRVSELENGHRQVWDIRVLRRALTGLGALRNVTSSHTKDSVRRTAEPNAPEDRRRTPQGIEAANRPSIMAGGGDESVSWLSEDLRRLESDYDVASSATVLTEAGQLHGVLRNTVEHCRGPQVARLRYLQARSALLMGQLVWDASNRRDGSAAAALFDEAAGLAGVCKDRDLAAQAQLRKSFIPLYGSGDIGNAVADAQRAANTAIRIPATRALAMLHIGEGAARLGQRGEAEHSLAVADRIAEQAELDETEWSGRRQRIAGSVFLSLQMPRRAQIALEGALPQLRSHKKSHALATANLALAHVRQADPEQASACLHRAMDLVEVTRAGGALTLIAAVSRELSPWRREPPVGEIHERLFDLLSS